MKKHLVLIFAVCTALLISCNSTRITSSWSLPGASAHKYNKVLVISMTGSKDRELRLNMENAVAKEFNAYNINAVTASSKYGPKTFQNMSDDEAAKMVNDDGFDGVIILALLDKNQEEYYTPGKVIRTPYAVVRSRWTSNYRVLYSRVYTPGYYSTTTNYELEANFYDAAKNELQYSAQATSFNPGSSEALSTDFSKSVIDDMIKKSVIMK
jgi:hypothetical protein